jgi:hypothetical protein
MQPGDLVRFPQARWTGTLSTVEHNDTWCVGLLVEYNTWEKICRILHQGKMVSVHVSNVEKAGKKDKKHYRHILD